MWHAISKEVYKYLDSLKVMWSSIDPVCFSEEGGKASPLYLWIGINLGTLSFQVAKAAAASCKMILASCYVTVGTFARRGLSSTAKTLRSLSDVRGSEY